MWGVQQLRAHCSALQAALAEQQCSWEEGIGSLCGGARRMESADKGECRGECEESMDNIITTHIRSRFAEGDVDMQASCCSASSLLQCSCEPVRLLKHAKVYLQ